MKILMSLSLVLMSAVSFASECYVTDTKGVTLLSREGTPVRYNGAENCTTAMTKKTSTVVTKKTATVPAIVPTTATDKTTVGFDTASSKLTTAQKKSLAAIVKALKTGEASSVQITGFADARGNATVNQKLSAQRAQAVKQWLAKNGVKASQIKAVGGGVKESTDLNDSRVAEVQVVR